MQENEERRRRLNTEGDFAPGAPGQQEPLALLPPGAPEPRGQQGRPELPPSGGEDDRVADETGSWKLDRVATAVTNMGKILQRLDAPHSANVVVWKGRNTSMKEFYDGMDKVTRLCARDQHTAELLAKVYSAGPVVTFEAKYYNKMKETMDKIKAKIESERLSASVAVYMAGGPMRKALEATSRAAFSALLEAGAQKEHVRTWWPISVTSPGWSLHYKGDCVISADTNLEELITTICIDDEVLKQINADVDVTTGKIIERVRGTGFTEAEMVRLRRPKALGRAPRKG